MGRRFFSPEARAELCRAFPHHSDAELAECFGLNVRQVQNIGFSEGLRKTPETIRASARRRQGGRHAAPLMGRIQQAIADAGDAGLSREAIESGLNGSSPSSVTTCLNKLVALQKVFRAGRPGRSRWFGSVLQAQAHIEVLTVAAKPAKAAPVKVAPSSGPARMPIAPLIPPGLQIQHGHSVPGPEVRWHGNALPVFSGLRPGQYADAPSSWVSAVTTKP